MIIPNIWESKIDGNQTTNQFLCWKYRSMVRQTKLILWLSLIHHLGDPLLQSSSPPPSPSTSWCLERFGRPKNRFWVKCSKPQIDTKVRSYQKTERNPPRFLADCDILNHASGHRLGGKKTVGFSRKRDVKKNIMVRSDHQELNLKKHENCMVSERKRATTRIRAGDLPRYRSKLGSPIVEWILLNIIS